MLGDFVLRFVLTTYKVKYIHCLFVLNGTSFVSVHKPPFMKKVYCLDKIG